MKNRQYQPTFRDLQERHMNDPKFRMLVESMHSMMLNNQITPYELRDAAYVASIKFAQVHIEPMFVHQNAYDTGKDPSLDSCVYCEQPYERK